MKLIIFLFLNFQIAINDSFLAKEIFIKNNISNNNVAIVTVKMFNIFPLPIYPNI